jgi:outer membrane protein assembly factor BamB
LAEPRINVTESDFPLEQQWEYFTDDDVYNLAVSDRWAVFSTRNNVTAIDTETGQMLWTKGLSLIFDSPILISNDELVGVSSKHIKIFSVSGQEMASIELDSEGGPPQLIARHSNYIFVLRTQYWLLEVYHAKTGEKLWDDGIYRGGIDIYYDENLDIGYAANSRSIRAFSLDTGDIIWEIPQEVNKSVYDKGKLYLVEDLGKDQPRSILSFDLENRIELWQTALQTYIDTDIFNLSVLNDKLIAVTETGLIAFDKQDGHYLWKSELSDKMYAKPVILESVIFVKNPWNQGVYAISPDDGDTVGYRQYGSFFIFAMPSYLTKSGIFQAGDTIVFSTSNAIYGFRFDQ